MGRKDPTRGRNNTGPNRTVVSWAEAVETHVADRRFVPLAHVAMRAVQWMDVFLFAFGMAMVLPMVMSASSTCSALEYDCQRELLAEELAPLFQPLEPDQETAGFLQMCENQAWTYRAKRYVRNNLKRFLMKFMSQTDALGYIGGGKMHVFSEKQVGELLNMTLEDQRKKTLLDVGAGEGGVTAKFVPYFEHTVVTEHSKAMVRRLERKKKFTKVLQMSHIDVDVLRKEAVSNNISLSDGKYFEAVALLNILDRCDAPISLMKQAKEVLDPVNGRLIVAVVLPFRPVVQDGRKKRSPVESVKLRKVKGWEKSVNAINEEIFKPLGFVIERVAKLPYLSEGNSRKSYYVLNDAIFVLRAQQTRDEEQLH